MEELDGTVSVQSRVGHGTTFRLQFPAPETERLRETLRGGLVALTRQLSRLERVVDDLRDEPGRSGGPAPAPRSSQCSTGRPEPAQPVTASFNGCAMIICWIWLVPS